MNTQKRLGRGLDALLGPDRPVPEARGAAAGNQDREMAIDDLAPGRYQPRRRLSEDSLGELAASIREQGVVQPLIVRPRATGSDAPRFEIVAGERRWRAARLAGLERVPVIVRELDDQSALAVALIENLQREDLNPIDQAQSLSQLAEEFELTHEQVARAVGRSRPAVSNLLRLLDLQDDVKELLAAGRLEMGHARALLSLGPEDQVAMARKTASRQLSVRQVEKAVRNLQHRKVNGDRRAPVTVDLQTRWLQQQLAGELDRNVTIRRDSEDEYALRIGFANLAELQEALQRIQELIGKVQATAGPRVRDARD